MVVLSLLLACATITEANASEPGWKAYNGHGKDILHSSDELSLSVLRGISSGIDHEEKEEDGFTDRLTVKIV